MRVISHRGCLEGPDPLIENHPNQINKAIKHKFDVEIDLWMIKEDLFLGHDSPQYKVSLDWLVARSDTLWAHCKNLKVLDWLSEQKSTLNYFFHQSDHVTLTSKNNLWVYPGMEFTKNSVIVVQEKKILEEILQLEEKPFAVCTDYPVLLL